MYRLATKHTEKRVALADDVNKQHLSSLECFFQISKNMTLRFFLKK